MSTRLVQVDMTTTMFVRLPSDQAEEVLDPEADYLNLCDRLTEWRRIAHYGPEHLDAGFTVSRADDVDLDLRGYPEPVDAVKGKPSYLWSARHFVMEARHQLSCGRYREGHCPELDEVNGALGRLEDRLRLMAFAADPTTAALAEQERAWAAERAAKHPPEKVVVFS